MSMVYFQQLGKAANRVDATATAFSHRDALCEWGCDAVWLDPAEDAANIRWAREVAEAMLPFTTGSDYVNHIGLEAEEVRNRIKGRLRLEITTPRSAEEQVRSDETSSVTTRTSSRRHRGSASRRRTAGVAARMSTEVDPASRCSAIRASAPRTRNPNSRK